MTLSKYERRQMEDELSRIKEHLNHMLHELEREHLAPHEALKLVEQEQHLRKKIQDIEEVLVPLLIERYKIEKSYRRKNSKALRKEIPRKIRNWQKKQAEMQAEVRQAVSKAKDQRQEAIRKAAEEYTSTLKEVEERKKKAA